MRGPLLRHIGYWINDVREETLCAPQEVVGFLPPKIRTRVADYLDRGGNEVMLAQGGTSWCRFCCGIESTAMGSQEWSDGHWVWPAGLSHYVREHEVMLPEEFIRDAQAKHPFWDGAGKRPELMSGRGADATLWETWCASHRSPAFVQRLRRARDEADVQAPAVREAAWQARIREALATRGLGSGNCQFAGCRETPLAGMRICARHYAWSPSDDASSCYQLGRRLLGSFAFGYDEIGDAYSLTRRLISSADPVSSFIRGRSKAGSLQLWADWNGSEENWQGYTPRTSLMNELDAVVYWAGLWDERRFAGVVLRDETRRMAGTTPSGHDLRRLNRWLLEDAYPSELRRIGMEVVPILSGWVVGDGEP